MLRILTSLVCLCWGIVLWFGFIILNVGPCNNREIPFERTAPIVAIGLFYGLIALLHLLRKDRKSVHYGLWLLVLGLGIYGLSSGVFDGDTYLVNLGMSAALSLAVCTPSVVVYVRRWLLGDDGKVAGMVIAVAGVAYVSAIIYCMFL